MAKLYCYKAVLHIVFVCYGSVAISTTPLTFHWQNSSYYEATTIGNVENCEVLESLFLVD